MSDRRCNVALVGWGPGPTSLSVRRVELLLLWADLVLVDESCGPIPLGTSSTRRAPGNFDHLVSMILDESQSQRVVWVAAADPLQTATGARLGRALSCAAVDWEYVPAVDESVFANPGAVCHLNVEAMSASEASRWRERFPLLGLRVAVTRAAHQASEMIAALSKRGADAFACPTIEIADPTDVAPLDDAIGRIGSYDWLVFTSANGVERFFARMLAVGADIRDLKGVRLAAIGPATARSIEARYLRVDVVPPRYVAESLFEALETRCTLADSRILIARAEVARDVLPDALGRAGAHVDVVDVYRTVRPPSAGDLVRLLDSDLVDLVAFTSSSTVTNFMDIVGPERAASTKAACIGPITAQTAVQNTLQVVVESDVFTVDGLVSAIESWHQSKR